MDTEDQLVSIVITTFNGASFLEKISAPSVLKQSYENWELIIVNDGSSDNTTEIVHQFQKEDKRIKYIEHDHNRGLAAAMNTGIKNAKGDIIAFLEHDDAWLPDKLEKQVVAMKKNNKAVCSTTRTWEVDFRKGKIYDVNTAALSGFMAYRSVFETIGLFNEERKLSGMQDADLKAMLDVAYAPDNQNYFLLLEEPSIVFFRHDDSLSSRRNGNPKKFIERYLAMCEKYDKPEFAADANIQRALNFWYVHAGLNSLLSGDVSLAKKNFAKSLIHRKNLSTLVISCLSFLPKRISWFVYAVTNNIKNMFGGIKVLKASIKYSHTYHEALELVSSHKSSRP